MASPCDGSGPIRLQLVFKHQQGNNHEVIKRVTNSHEVVDVDGFVFRRKRRASAPPEEPPPGQQDSEHAPSGTPPARSPSAVRAGLRFSPEARTDAPGEGDAAAAPDAAAVAVAVDAAALAVRRSTRFAIPQDELTYLVQWLLTSELKRAGGMDASRIAATAAAVTDRFAVALREHLGRGGGAEGGGGGAAAPAPADAGSAAAAGAALPLSSLVALPHQVARLREQLQAKRDRLLQEEQAWLQLQTRYATGRGASPTDDTATAAGAATRGQAQATAAADAAEPAASLPAGVPSSESVVAAKRAAVEAMALRAEAVCAQVAKMEQLAANAEAAASKLQEEFQHERFRLFPHVNSPARLIKSILHSGAAAGAAQ